MKSTHIHSLLFGATASLALGVVLAPRAAAAITDADFGSLSNLVQQLNERVHALEQTHAQDQKVHARDQQQIRQMQQQLGQTQVAVTNAMQQAQAAAQVQPTVPVPSGPSASHNFTMVGDAEVQYGKVDGSHGSFGLADFAPIFLYRSGDDILFEAGFDTTLSDNRPGSTDPGASTSFDLSFAQLDYLLNDYVTVAGGYMLLPLGTYAERSAGWLNKIPDDPLPRDVVPSNGAGVQLRGSVAVGQAGQMLTYSVYGVNGPSSADGTANAGKLDLDSIVGFDSNGNRLNLHGSPSGGGRIGWFFPLKPHYDLELGLSGQSGTWDDADQHQWSAGVVDAALHVSPYFEAKGEYINSWYGTSDAGTVHPNGWWVQAAYKLAGLQLDMPVVNNVELVGRYDTERDGLGMHADRYTLGYVYYFTDTLLFEGDYEFLSSNSDDLNHNECVFQLSYGF